MTPSPWGRSPPRSGLSRYSGIQMEPGCIPPPAQPAGAEPPPPASSRGLILLQPSQSSQCRPSSSSCTPHHQPGCRTSPSRCPPPPGNSVFPEPAGGGHKRVRGWGRGATGVTQRGEPAGGRGIPAAAAQRSPYLLLMSLSGGDPGARGFYSAR